MSAEEIRNFADYLERTKGIEVYSGDREPGRSASLRGKEWIVAGLRLLADGEWRPIAELPDDDSIILAKTDDGRFMVWRANFLRGAMKPNTPEHLRFPASGWKLLQQAEPPAVSREYPKFS